VEEHHLTVQRTARYHTVGDPAAARHIWVVLHGYGQLARFFLRPFEGLAEGRLIAAPEGLSRFYLDDDHSRVGATWMTREDREREIGDQAVYLDRLVERLLEQCGGVRPVSVLGFSQGVATACRWSAVSRNRFVSLVLWGGTMPPEHDAATLRECWARTRVELVHGEEDTVVPAEALAQNEARLRDAGVAYTTHRTSGGHALDPITLQRLLAG
jgi:predicted esterase